MMVVSGTGGGSNVGGVGPMGDPTPDNEVQNMTNDLWAIASYINEGSFADVPKYIDDLCANWQARTNSNSWGNPPSAQEQKIIDICKKISTVTDSNGKVEALGIISFKQLPNGNWIIQPAPMKGESPQGTTWWDPGSTPRVGDPDANQYIVQIIDTTLQPN